MVPEGWSSVPLSALFEFKNGLGADAKSYGSGIKFVNVMDVFSGASLTEDCIIGSVQVSPRQVDSYSLRYGDVLFNRTSETPEEIAYATVYLDNKPAVFGSFVIRARPVDDRLEANFCKYVFQPAYVREQMISRCQGAIRANIGQADLRKVKMLLPPKSEQGKISKILSTWDRAIEVTERLILNSQTKKRALVQHLCTGKVRLAGFSKPWRKLKLAQLGPFKKGKGIRRDELVDQGLPCVLYGDIYTRHNDFIREFSSYTTSEVARTSERISSGDLLFAGSGETAADIGKCVAFVDDFEAYAGGDIVILSVKNDDSKFLAYLMNSASVIEQKARFGQGNSVVHISATNLGRISISLPDLEEQKAIASVLERVDEEILNLELQLKHLTREKKALMQQLLTGKRRVKVEASV